MTNTKLPLAAPPRSHVACATCGLQGFCFSPAGVDGCVALEAAMTERRRLRTGEVLFARGDRQTALYAVRAGFVKTCAVLPDGARRILGYHLMGDILGLDAMASGVHPTEAIALNGCEVCAIALDRAQALLAGRRVVEMQLRYLMSEALARAQDHMVALAALTAKQRVAGYVLDLSERWARRGYSASRFDLGLTRREMGSYLGLTFETVSRALSHFDASGALEVEGRDVRIVDLERLRLARDEA